jgi:hypothetical protein
VATESRILREGGKAVLGLAYPQGGTVGQHTRKSSESTEAP